MSSLEETSEQENSKITLDDCSLSDFLKSSFAIDFSEQVLGNTQKGKFELPDDDDISFESRWEQITNIEIGEEGDNHTELSPNELAEIVEFNRKEMTHLNFHISDEEILNELKIEQDQAPFPFPPLSAMKEVVFNHLSVSKKEAEANNNSLVESMANDYVNLMEIEEVPLPKDKLCSEPPHVAGSIPAVSFSSPPPPSSLLLKDKHINSSFVKLQQISVNKGSNGITLLPDQLPVDTLKKSKTKSSSPAHRTFHTASDKTDYLISRASAIQAVNSVIASDNISTLTTNNIGNDSTKPLFKTPNGKARLINFPKPTIFVITPPKIVLPRRSTTNLKYNENRTISQSGDPLEQFSDSDTANPTPNDNGASDIILECEFCPESFSSYDDNLFRKHLLIQHEFEIDEDTYFDSRKAISAAPRKPINHSCGFCGKVFSARYELKRHIHSSHEQFLPKLIMDFGFRCAQCLKSFSSSFELTNHHLMCYDRFPNHETLRDLAKSYLNCDVCGTTHSNTHEASFCYISKSILRCPLCFDIFKKKDSLKKHLSIFHGLAQSKPCLPCPFCPLNNPKWGGYQDIFPHIVADHFQPTIDGINSTRNPPSPVSPGLPVVTSVFNNYTDIPQSSNLQLDPSMPIVTSVFGNYTGLECLVEAIEK